MFSFQLKCPLHKKGTGSRINTYQINNPLRWNEVTETAHWYGHGNASVVALLRQILALEWRFDSMVKL